MRTAMCLAALAVSCSFELPSACPWRAPREAKSQPADGECLRVTRSSGDVSVFAFPSGHVPSPCDVVDRDCEMVCHGDTAWIAAPVPFGGESDHVYESTNKEGCEQWER
jgi:hypothetical protein